MERCLVAHNVCVCGICIVAHFTTLLGDSAYPPRTELPDDEQKQRKGEERKGNKRWARPFLPLSVARSLTRSFICSPSFSPPLSHTTTSNRPCSFLSTNTHTHSATFASLNSLMYVCVRVCVWVYYLCFLCRQKKTFITKNNRVGFE